MPNINVVDIICPLAEIHRFLLISEYWENPVSYHSDRFLVEMFQNHPLSLNLVVCCAKIGPKTQKLQKTIEKPSFFVVFLVIFEVF